MKKSLALLLVIALVFTVFSGAVFAGKGSGNGSNGNSNGSISNNNGGNNGNSDNGGTENGNKNNDNGTQNSEQLNQQDQIQEHIDDSFYQNLNTDLTEEKQAEFDQLKENFFSDRDEINDELRDKRQTLNTLDADNDQAEIVELESEITELEDKLSQIRDDHINEIEDLVGEEITETE